MNSFCNVRSCTFNKGCCCFNLDKQQNEVVIYKCCLYEMKSHDDIRIENEINDNSCASGY